MRLDIGNTPETRPGLDRFLLKIIAAAAMTLDHIAAVFVSYRQTPALFLTMRVVGRLTAPIMCFFIAEGFAHTSSKTKYALRLGVFAVISQVPYSLLHHGRPFAFDFSMMTTLFLSFLVLCVYEYAGTMYLKLPLMMMLTAVCVRCDWYFFAPVWVLTFHIFRDSRRKQIAGYALMSALMIGGWIVYYRLRRGSWINLLQLGVFPFIPLLALYNGRRGPGGPVVKYFYYIYYPLHILALYLLKFCI